MYEDLPQEDEEADSPTRVAPSDCAAERDDAMAAVSLTAHRFIAEGDYVVVEV